MFLHKRKAPAANATDAKGKTDLISTEELQLLHAFFALVNQQSYSSIAGDVNRGTWHIQDTVDTCDKSGAFQRQTKASQNHGQHDEACTRNTCSTDRSQSTGNDNGHILGSGEVNAVQLSNEQCAYTLISSSTIHVDGCAQRQNEAGNFFRSAHF